MRSKIEARGGERGRPKKRKKRVRNRLGKERTITTATDFHSEDTLPVSKMSTKISDKLRTPSAGVFCSTFLVYCPPATKSVCLSHISSVREPMSARVLSYHVAQHLTWDCFPIISENTRHWRTSKGVLVPNVPNKSPLKTENSGTGQKTRYRKA
jgi:hypothetical protein